MDDFGGFEIEFVNLGGAVDAIWFLVLHVADDEIQKARLRKPFQRNSNLQIYIFELKKSKLIQWLNIEIINLKK